MNTLLAFFTMSTIHLHDYFHINRHAIIKNSNLFQDPQPSPLKTKEILLQT